MFECQPPEQRRNETSMTAEVSVNRLEELTTDRLKWRPLVEQDAPHLRVLAQDAGVRGCLLDVVEGQTQQRVNNWTEGWADQVVRSESMMGLVFRRVDDALIGVGGLYDRAGSNITPHLLCGLLPAYVNKGMGTELGRALLAQAFETTGMDMVLGVTKRMDRASIRVLEKLGFVRSSTHSGASGPRDEYVIGISIPFTVGHSWDGLSRGDGAIVKLTFGLERLAIEVDAPFFDDPPPPSLPGPTGTDRLWEHEVVEVFLAGDDERYLEVELGPHGHQLVLDLHGPRRIKEQGMAIEFRAIIQDARWCGRALIPSPMLPSGLATLNVCSIRGVGRRQHCAWKPVGGEVPDFHRLEAFGDLAHEVRRKLHAGNGVSGLRRWAETGLSEP